MATAKKLCWLIAGLATATPYAHAATMTNVTINGVSYTKGMKFPASADGSITIAGKIVVDPSKDRVFADGNGGVVQGTPSNNPYPGYGTFAFTTSPCQSITNSDMGSIRWTTPNCYPLFSNIHASNEMGVASMRGLDMDIGFASDGSFSKTLPAQAISPKVITYQQSRAGWDVGYGAKAPQAGYFTGWMAAMSPGAQANYSPSVTFTFASNLSASALASGKIRNQSITATMAADSDDIGVSGNTYVAAEVPGVGLFLLSTKGGWMPYDGTDVPAQANVTLTSNMSLPVVTSATDLTGLEGTNLYVGAGKNLKDVVDSFKFQKVYTVQ